VRASVALVLLTFFMLPVAGGCEKPSSPPSYSYRLQAAFPNLTFVQPVDVQNAGDGTNRLFVVEKPGVVKVFPNDQAVASAKTFLDIAAKVVSGGLEQGLLGLAFHPDFETNGYFFVYYTIAGNDNRLSRFQVSAGNPDSADAGTEAVLLEFAKTAANHNGGQLAFGPDGYLYVGVGDGGGAGDPDENGQDLTTLLGTMLRLDVDSQDLGNYGIPSTNPFGFSIHGYRPEIYAYGLRNPWRFSFDPATGWLWAGDVGQSLWEEIDIIEIGGNYGWNCYEGTHVYATSLLCDTLAVQIDPIYEYPHGAGNVSVTGGHVYRGPTVSSLTGTYVFADYNSGRIWGIRYDIAGVTPAFELLDSDYKISAFGVDEASELYVCDIDAAGSPTHIYRLIRVAD
jgi:glucose/arabinose dehydrogenase